MGTVKKARKKNKNKIVVTNRFDSNGDPIPESMTNMELELNAHKGLHKLDDWIDILSSGDYRDDAMQEILAALSEFRSSKGQVTLDEAFGFRARSGLNIFEVERKIKERGLCNFVMEHLILNLGVDYVKAAEVGIAYANISKLQPDSMRRERLRSGTYSVCEFENPDSNLRWFVPFLNNLLARVNENQKKKEGFVAGPDSQGFIGAIKILEKLISEIEAGTY